MIFDRAAACGAVTAVIVYRRFLSPVKGFSCPHHLVHGAGSCSDFGLDAFRRFGFRAGLKRLRERFRECKAAARSLMMAAAEAANATDDSPAPEKRKKKEKWYERWCGDFGCGWPSCGGRRRGSDLDGSDCGGGDGDFIPDCSW